MSEKDETDIELAVERALSYNPKQIILTGVTGGRLDHMESALHLLYRLQMANPDDIIFDSVTVTINYRCFYQEHLIEHESDDLPYVSLFPFEGPVTGLT